MSCRQLFNVRTWFLIFYLRHIHKPPQPQDEGAEQVAGQRRVPSDPGQLDVNTWGQEVV